MASAWAFWLIGRSAHELTLFAAVGLLVGGVDDLAIDLLWLLRGLRPRRREVLGESEGEPGRIAVFVGAWREANVIGGMLHTALDRFDHPDYRIFVGVYPNDPDTIAAVRTVAATHPLGHRLRAIGGALDGPTTKAEALNRLWRALQRDEAREGAPFRAIVIHDAEDVVHPAELRLFDALIGRYDLVQLPVLPLVDGGSRWVSGHYCDEFAEAHGKQLVVREWIGAGVPLAGTGCALSRAALERLAEANGGDPFDGDSLTEDYEIGLRIAAFGGRATFARVRSGDGLVAVRAYFPADLDAAVRQKTRWMTGIALAGWDRLGWQGGLVEAWMRLRDRRAILAAIVLAAAYAALVLNTAALAIRLAGGPAIVPSSHRLSLLSAATCALLLWRLAMRSLMVGRTYGWREGARSVPRTIVANAIGMMAARRAVLRYAFAGRRAPVWDKTEHHFPAELPAA